MTLQRRAEWLADDRPGSSTSAPAVAVLIPCLDEENTVGAVVSGFRTALPEAAVHVYDNGSTDMTVQRAVEAGAGVRREPMPGKGNVVRRMFADVEAEVYVMADGDGTYDPAEAALLVKRLVEDDLDMVVGIRVGPTGRLGHRVGNRLFNRLYQWLFGTGFTDIFSGYRVLSRRFVRSFPAGSTGFEIETEMAVHASQLRLPVAEVEVSYRERPEGSESKLRTLPDGWRILRAMGALLRDNRPLALFGWLAAGSTVAALALGVPVVVEFVRTGLVERLPTAVLATGLTVAALVLTTIGFVLDAVARARVEVKRLAYLQNRPN